MLTKTKRIRLHTLTKNPLAEKLKAKHAKCFTRKQKDQKPFIPFSNQ